MTRVKYKPSQPSASKPVDGIVEFSPPSSIRDQKHWEAHLIFRFKVAPNTVHETRHHAELHGGTWYGSKMKYACGKAEVQLISELWEVYISALTVDDSASNTIEIEIEE